jgi:hypothetical protein
MVNKVNENKSFATVVKLKTSNKLASCLNYFPLEKKTYFVCTWLSKSIHVVHIWNELTHYAQLY